MSKYLIHAILRQYLAVARGEKFFASEVGDTFLDADCVQLNWMEDAKIGEWAQKSRGYDYQDLFEKGIIARPSPLENSLICAELRKYHKDLGAHPQFNQAGEFVLSKKRGVLYAEKQHGLISALTFFEVKII